MTCRRAAGARRVGEIREGGRGRRGANEGGRRGAPLPDVRVAREHKHRRPRVVVIRQRSSGRAQCGGEVREQLATDAFFSTRTGRGGSYGPRERSEGDGAAAEAPTGRAPDVGGAAAGEPERAVSGGRRAHRELPRLHHVETVRPSISWQNLALRLVPGRPGGPGGGELHAKGNEVSSWNLPFVASFF